MTLRAVAPTFEMYDEDGQRSISEAIDFAIRLVPNLRTHLTVHDFVVASVFRYLPVLSSLLTDTPLITMWHEVWDDYLDEYLGKLGFGDKLVEQLTASLRQYPIAMSDITAERDAAITPPSQRIQVVPNGIDVDKMDAAPLPTAGHRSDGKPRFDVLFAGRLIENKKGRSPPPSVRCRD